MKKIIFFALTLFLLFPTACKKEEVKGKKNGTIKILGSEDSADNPSGETKVINLDNAYDMSSKTINYYQEQALTDEEAKIKESEEPFVITDFGPKGELPAEMRKPTIYVSFNHPIIPLSKLGEVMKTSSIIKIIPEVKGVYRFYGTRMLSFEPDESILPQREYQVTISKDLKSLGGKSITGETSFKFSSEYLRIVSFNPSYFDVPIKEAKTIRIVFSYPINLDLIKKYLKIESNGKEYSFGIKSPGNEESINDDLRMRTVILTADGDFEPNADVKVTLLKDAKSEEGFLGTKNDIVNSFGTIRPFRFLTHQTYSYEFVGDDYSQTNPLYLTFTHPLDKESVFKFIEISYSDLNINDHISVYDRTIKIFNLPVKYNSTYRVTVKSGLKDIYGRDLSKEEKITVEVPDAYSYYYFPNLGDKILESQFPAKIAFELQNVFEGKWKVDSITDPFSLFGDDELVPYDFSKYEENMKYIEIVDLKPYLNKSGKGSVGLSWDFATRNYGYSYRQNLNLQVTDIGVSVRYGYNKFTVMASSLSTGEPVSNAKVKLRTVWGKIFKEEKTDTNGVAIFELKEGDFKKNFYYSYNAKMERPRVIVEKDDDKVEFSPNGSHNVYQYGIYSTRSPSEVENEKEETFIFTDRGLYKPGETLTFRGIDKTLRLGNYTAYKGKYIVSAKDGDYSSKPFWTEEGKTTDSGGFYGSFKIPENAAPGDYSISYKRNDGSAFYGENLYFQVANFRRLNFQVNMKSPNVEYYKGDTINTTLKASYLSGGVMGGASYDYYWIKSSSYFKPAGSNWKTYKFGTYDYQSDENLSSGNGKLSGSGEATIKQSATGEFKKGLTYLFSCYSNVVDIDRQLISASSAITVHPANAYLGMKFRSSDAGYWSPFVTKGTNVTVDYALVKPDGSEYSPQNYEKINVKLYRIEWKTAQQQGVYDRINTLYQREEILESEQNIGVNSFSGNFVIKPEKSGEYIIRGETKDNKGRTAFTEFTFYSTGSEWVRWGGDNAEGINLMLEKSSYKVGEKARIMLQSPLPKGKYLVTIEREGIFEEKVYDFSGSANFIEITAKEEYVPVFYVAVTSYGKRTEEPPKKYGDPDLGKPKGYFGITTVYVSTETKEINLVIQSDKKSYKPGEEAEYTIQATRDGKPLPNTEITFLAVDRGVLDLINYHIPNPISFFYSAYKFPLGIYGADSRSLLIDPVTYEMKNLFGGDDGSKGPNIRKDFSPTAVFHPFLVTDENGMVKVKFKLPDTLTTYRVTALAVNKDFYGLKESETMVKNPVNVRMALPRRLRLRDTTFAGVIVTNLDNMEHEVTVKMESDILSIEGQSEKKVKLPANSICEIPFKIIALKEGVANISFTTVAGGALNEKLLEKIVVERPTNKEVFATIGTITDGFKEEGVVIPTNITPNFGGLTLRLDSTRINTLGESISYLYDYPYLCMEQRTSKLFPLVVFKDTVNNFIKIDNVKKTVENELEVWAKYQNSDGGFPYWLEGTRKSEIFVSIKVAKFLYYAKQNGFIIPAKLNLRKLLDYIANYKYESGWEEFYSKPYSFYVRSLHGENVLISARDFFESKKDSLGVSEYAMLGLTFYNLAYDSLAGECLAKLENLVKVGTQSIDLLETYGGSYYFNSEVSKIALFLALYGSIKNDNDMITRIANTLTSRQKGGYWGNTYTTEWVIEAFYKLYQKEGKEDTDYLAKIMLDGKQIFEATFKGINDTRVIKNLSFDTDLKDFAKNRILPLNVSKEGRGVLYYTASLKYSLPSEIIKSRDEGFSVFSEITNLDGKVIDGKTLKLGETYKMKVVINTSKRRNFVALRCPVPSGAEILDSSFVTMQNIKPDQSSEERADYEDAYSDYGYYDYYYDYGPVQKIYDNEVQYFFDDINSGSREAEFIFRITTPGIFPTPPSYVECMYEDEVFGRNSGKVFVVNPK